MVTNSIDQEFPTKPAGKTEWKAEQMKRASKSGYLGGMNPFEINRFEEVKVDKSRGRNEYV